MTSDLKRVVESQHGGTATLNQTVCLLTRRNKISDWDGTVYIFDLTGNGKANRAYAWASPVTGTDDTRYFAVLHRGRITSPIEAVRAAAAALRGDMAKSA